VNASKVVDPVAIFGSFNVNVGLPAKHLSQTQNNLTLTEVRPGAGIGFGVGFAYALSYNISTTMSFQESINARSKLTLRDSDGTVKSASTAPQAAGMLNFGLGVRMSPLTTVNVNVGVGLTTDTPDFTFGINVPLHF
jgi:opacity protein-like surface antigen